ncbi:hypothetical protein WJM97_21975 [Okeanomitos corallinicola TIOX110]|uniref:Calcineurin-like phosphoesterase domain-containing protein n=1 Tax=Okeanomitos corallinicola TIOX110 TaxID=3133117 RepID=A0ABZ2USA2_9CYAN
MKNKLTSKHPQLFQLVVSFLLFLFIFTTGVKAETLSSKAPVTFAAYGDIPYMVKLADGRTDEQVLREDIAPKIRENDHIPFVFHLGDLGRPQDACSDAWLEKNQKFWKDEIVKPVFYTPGDNDWTDCDRESLNVPQSELERLDAIRRVLFNKPKTVNAEWQYEQQSTLPENETWWYEDIRFVTQHIVSTDNGRSEILLDDPEKVNQLVDQRDKENAMWLDYAFDLAKNDDTSAVVVATQLDPFTPDGSTGDVFSRCINNPAYKGFCQQLQTLAANLDKPVLLLHGDTNAYCFDQPFPVSETPKLWRLNAPGDYKVIDAALISFDPTSSAKPFQVTGLLSGQAPPQVCDYSR